jgi:voltage-gated potassium channel
MMFIVMRLLRRAVRHPPSIVRVLVLLAAILAYGASGFLYFEVASKPELGWGDAIWWALVTLTTVGYGDVAPVSDEGRFLVAVPLMVFGIGLLGYLLSLAAAAVVEAKSREVTGMAKTVLEQHLILVNLPNLGKVERVLDELLQPSALGPTTQVVLIDEDLTQLPAELERRNVHFVKGNPARDETLTRASLDEARYAVVLSKKPGDPQSDNQSIAVALAIEARASKVETVVECVDPSMQELLRKTGCDSIVCASRFDAQFLGAEVVHPGVQEVIEHLLSTIKGGQQLFVTPVPKETPFADLARTCVARGHMAIGAKQKGKLQLNPKPEVHLGQGDQLVTIGPTPLSLD